MKQKRKEVSKIPNLRFPEFGMLWKECEIGDILKIGSGKDYKHLSEGDIPVFGTGGYMTSVNDYLFDGETVCIGRKGTINKPFYFNGRLWTVDTLFYSHSFRNVIPKFVFYVFEQVNWLKYNEASGVPSLSKKTIEQIKVTIPEINEQKRISNLLSLIDEKIQTQNKIIEHLETLIKGFRQKLFSQELRFKDDNGNDFPEWEEKKLGHYLKHKSVRNKSFEVIRVLSVSNSKGFILQSEQFDNHRVASKDVSNYKIVKKNDIAYNPSRINVGSIATLKDFEEGIVSPMYVVFNLKNTLNLTFFENLITTHLFKHLVKIGCSGSVRDSLNFEDLESFKLKLPTLNEQIKIADFLISITKKNVSERKILAEFESQKKYLLQNMFI